MASVRMGGTGRLARSHDRRAAPITHGIPGPDASTCTGGMPLRRIYEESMIVQGIIGVLGGVAILIGGLVLLDVRLIGFGLLLLFPSLYVIYFWFRKL